MVSVKISIIGAGHVGSACAHWLLCRKLGHIVLLDIQDGRAKGLALDLLQSGALNGTEQYVVGTSDYTDISNSQVVIITAGQARKPGMSRADLLKINATIITGICKNIKKYAPQSIVLVVTNPLDVMSWLAWKELDFPTNRVIGMAGILDTSRFRTFVAQELGVSVRDVQAFVLGGHGDTMVILSRLCHVGGIPLHELLSQEKIDNLIERAQKGGIEIVSLLKNSSAYYAPAISVVEMVEAVLMDQKRILPCSTYLKGEYGVKDLYMGVLCKLGRRGVEKIMQFSLSSKEQKKFQKSADVVREQVQQL